jgi:hypothetical protein
MAMATQTVRPTTLTDVESSGSQSAVSWAAIIGGAVAALGITLLLVALGSGIGLSSASPWSSANPTATTFTLVAAVWLIIVQWLSSGMGGYLAGRLRTKWVGVHTDEVFFRDTAHGFITWAVATLFIAVGLGSAVSSLIGADLRGGATLAAASTAAPASPVPRATLLVVQSPVPPAEAAPADSGDGLRLVLPQQQPRPYGTQLVLAQDPSERADAPSAPGMRDPERRDAALGSLLTALSMLIGAFIAGVAAAIGGRLRDEHP